MSVCRWFPSVVAVALAAALASAQEPPPKPPAPPPTSKAPPPTAKAPPRKIEPLTFESIEVKPEELPPDVKLVEGTPTVAPQPRTYFENPSPFDSSPPEIKERLPDNLREMLQAMPVPKRKASQAFQAEGGRAGSVMWFEFEADPQPKLGGWLRGVLWGENGGPTPRHPETCLFHGNLLVITSFPQGDRAHEWWKERQRRKFGVHAPRWSKELSELASAVLRAQEARKWDEALALLAAKDDVVRGDAFLSYLRGESALGKGDHATAETGYRRALELHESREDPLNPILVWPTLDGLGAALVVQKKLEDAAKVLPRAVELGRAQKPKGWTTSLYNLACCESLRKRWDKAFAALKEAVEAEPSWKASARGDSDLAEALKRPEFQKLVAE